MLRRVYSRPISAIAGTSKCAAAGACFSAVVAPQLNASVATKYEHMSAPIGQGKVMPLKFDYLRPHYAIPTLAQYFVVMGAYFQTLQMPIAIICFTIIFLIHGGFTGHLPPDPRELHH